MQPKGLYEPELVKLWRERMRRFELSELVRSLRVRNKPTREQGPTPKTEERARTSVDA